MDNETLAKLHSVDIERINAWEAWSELFLDTSVDDSDLDRIARQLAATRFSIQELNYIYLHEVSPVCSVNFFQYPGGEWAFFDIDWLIDECSTRQKLHPYPGDQKKSWWEAFSTAIGAINEFLGFKPIIKRVENLRAAGVT